MPILLPRRPYVTVAAALAIAVAGAAPAAAAAKRCPAPGEQWERATPAEAGMDPVRLQEALDHGTSNLGFAVRVYRHGCLVGEDRLASSNRTAQYESWSMAKSVTSMVFGRAMTMGLVSPDDPVGSLVVEADREHGEITLRDLLTMTSGLRWNGFRDYNIFTLPDRVRDALTLERVHRPGTFYEYAQSAVSLLAEATGRAVGEDFERFAERELMARIGIRPAAWRWERDRAGNVLGFMGVNMVPDDFGRLGELLRRGGVWRGERLLSRRYVEESVRPTPTNGCYGWLIWVNASAPCVGPRLSDRPVSPTRDMPDLPADMFRFSGLFGQIVTVFPTQGLVVVRTGQDPGLVFAGGQDWERGLYERVLAAITDQEVERPGELRAEPGEEDPNADQGFQTALLEPDQYGKGVVQEPLPPAGPARARAPRIRQATARAGRRGAVSVRIACPGHSPGRRARDCSGAVTLQGASRAVPYRLRPGATGLVRLRLPRSSRPPRGAVLRLAVKATNTDDAGGATARSTITIRG